MNFFIKKTFSKVSDRWFIWSISSVAKLNYIYFFNSHSKYLKEWGEVVVFVTWRNILHSIALEWNCIRSADYCAHCWDDQLLLITQLWTDASWGVSLLAESIIRASINSIKSLLYLCRFLLWNTYYDWKFYFIVMWNISILRIVFN